MSEFQDAATGFRGCPTCGRADRVENVAVVRDRAVVTTREAVAGPPVFAGPDQPAVPGPMRQRSVTRPTPLGRRLSPAPTGTARPLVALGVFTGVFAAVAFYVHQSAIRFVGGGSQSSLPPVVGVLLGAMSVASLLLAVGVQVRRGPVRRGREKAEETSRLGWYCGRCGTVYFQPGAAPEGARDSTSYSLAEFRRFVFRTGGYENLVNARSVR
jgi:hypothetical protein